MEALKAAASRAAAEAANKLAALQRAYDLVVTERDALRSAVASLRAQVCGSECRTEEAKNIRLRR